MAEFLEQQLCEIISTFMLLQHCGTLVAISMGGSWPGTRGKLDSGEGEVEVHVGPLWNNMKTSSRVQKCENSPVSMQTGKHILKGCRKLSYEKVILITSSWFSSHSLFLFMKTFDLELRPLVDVQNVQIYCHAYVGDKWAFRWGLKPNWYWCKPVCNRTFCLV